MLKSILLSILLSGCATQAKTTTVAATPVASVVKVDAAEAVDLRKLDYRLLNLEYEHSVEKCFIYLEICNLKAGGESKACWKTHEACVINESKRYQHLREVHGF